MGSSHSSSLAAASLLVLGVTAGSPASPALGQGAGVLSLVATGNQATAAIGVGGLGLDLTIDFEDASGLSASSLGLSARLATVTELVGRLPAGVSLAAGFPLLVSIEPPSTGGLELTGLATVGVHTHNLGFVPNSPLRLFKAPLGGAFVDVTDSMGAGSYRARGRCGGFSELLILIDGRATSSVVDTKLARLADLLAAHDDAMPASLAEGLAESLQAVDDAWAEGDEAEAMAELDDFTALVEAHSGTDIPELWRAARDVTNVAGELRAAAATLRFSLAQAAS